MTSPTPLLYDTVYHIYNRGINGENIFIQEKNFSHFLTLYTKYIEPVAETYAYCLLRNHFHLLVRIKSEAEILKTLKVFQTNPSHSRQGSVANKEESLARKPLGSIYPSKRFSDFFNAYAKAINAAYGRTGSLFQHPFGRKIVTSNDHLIRVVAYIHQNPQKHGLVSDFREWKFSSYGAIMTILPTHIKREDVIRLFGGMELYCVVHQEHIAAEQTRDFMDDDAD